MHLLTPDTAFRAGCGPQNHPQAIIAISFPDVEGVKGSSGHNFGTIPNELFGAETTIVFDRARNAGLCKNALVDNANVTNKISCARSFMSASKNGSISEKKP